MDTRGFYRVTCFFRRELSRESGANDCLLDDLVSKTVIKSRHGNPIVKNFININLFVSFQNLFGFSVASVVVVQCHQIHKLWNITFYVLCS